jgi:hypothetical protein
MSLIRLAIAEDLPDLVELAQQAHLESRLAWIPFRAQRLWRTLETRISNSNHCLIVAYNPNYELIGFLHGQLERYDFASASLARLQHWYVSPKVRGSLVAMKMFTGFQQWAQQKQVVELVVTAQFDNARTDAQTIKLLQKLGLKQSGITFNRWIES